MWMVGWLVGCVLYHINPCEFFNAKSCFIYIYIYIYIYLFIYIYMCVCVCVCSSAEVLHLNMFDKIIKIHFILFGAFQVS